MTYKEYVDTYESLSSARKVCGMASCCSTCMYAMWASSTTGYPADKEIESRCVRVKKGNN